MRYTTQTIRQIIQDKMLQSFFSHGPFTMTTYSPLVRSYYLAAQVITHCVKDRRGKVVWAGPESECNDVMDIANELCALRTMTEGTKAEGLVTCSP